MVRGRDARLARRERIGSVNLAPKAGAMVEAVEAKGELGGMMTVKGDCDVGVFVADSSNTENRIRVRLFRT